MLKSVKAEILMSFNFLQGLTTALSFYCRYLKSFFINRTTGKFSATHNYICQWLAVATFLNNLVFGLDAFLK